MLMPEQQQRFLRDHPGAFKPAAGAWGASGATLVRFVGIDEEIMGEVLTLCWQNAAAKSAAQAAKKGATGRTGRTRRTVKKKRKKR